jgi:hypothetical protein
MIRAEKYDVSQSILIQRMIFLFIAALITLAVYLQFSNAIQIGGALAAFAGIALLFIGYFYSRYSSLGDMQIPVNYKYHLYADNQVGVINDDSNFTKFGIPPFRHIIADFTLTQCP